MATMILFSIVKSIKSLFRDKGKGNKFHPYPKQCNTCNGELTMLHTGCHGCNKGLICKECLIYGITLCDDCQITFLSN